MNLQQLVKDISSSIKGHGPYRNSDEVEAAIETYVRERITEVMQAHAKESIRRKLQPDPKLTKTADKTVDIHTFDL